MVVPDDRKAFKIAASDGFSLPEFEDLYTYLSYFCHPFFKPCIEYVSYSEYQR